MQIEYDIPFEVTEKQYNRLMVECAGIVAGRKDGDRYFVKVWVIREIEAVRKILNRVTS